MRRCGVLAMLVAVAGGCGDDDAAEAPSAAVVRDVRALQRLVGADLAGAPLEEVDEMVAEDRPVAAADLLRAGGIPAARRHLEQVRAASVATAEGRAFHRELVDAYELRLEGLERYATALERGPVEDLDLVEALGAQREAAAAVIDIDGRMAEIRPLPEARERRREVRR